MNGDDEVPACSDSNINIGKPQRLESGRLWGTLCRSGRKQGVSANRTEKGGDGGGQQVVAMVGVMQPDKKKRCMYRP